MGGFRPSIDPLAATSSTTYTPGKPFSIHSPDELKKLLEANKDKLVVLKCKSSHCKPCQRFAPTYQRIAQLMGDSVFLVMTGDETPETKKYMVENKVKVTPTFQMFRDGQMAGSVTGAKLEKVLPGIQAHLKSGERGKQLVPDDIDPVTTDEE